MNAVILSTGDELVLGQTVDTNSAWLSAQLSACGVMTLYHKTVGDDLESVAEAILEGAGVADLIILTGGLGPTADDITREALARVMNAPLKLHKPSLMRIHRFFKKINRSCPAVNDVQAMCPRGADLLDNDWGTAPGLGARIGKAKFFAFPGVPYEMKRMFPRYILPLLTGNTGRTILTESIVTFGAGESMVASRLGDIMRRDRNPLVGTTVSEGIITVRIRSEGNSVVESKRMLIATVKDVEKRLGKLVIGRDGASLPVALGELLKRRHMMVATAESCTGGLVAKMLTDVPGSSEWYRGGWVVYSNALKETQLAVPAKLLAKHGAVSEPVVRAMAEGALAVSGADYAVATTGIAGPGGGSPRKPVGTVWIALAVPADGGTTVTSQVVTFPGERETIRGYAAKTALNMLRLHLLSDQP
ncbi:MAG: competence/damage-inducible protein A [bacterium]